MKLRTTTRIVVPAVVLLGLSACGSGGGTSSESGDAGPVGRTDTGEPDVSAGEVVGENESGSGDRLEQLTDEVYVSHMGDDIDLTDAAPRIITSACGTLQIDDVPVSTSQATSATLMEGQLARGRIDPAIAANTEHFWSVDLQPGYHHLFVESRRVDGDANILGLVVEEVGPDGETIESMVRGSAFERRARFGEFFVNGEPRRLTLRVSPRYSAEDYVIGVFGNGRSIPSPLFDDCPAIEGLSLGTTVATRLPTVSSEEDVSWYRIGLAKGDYLFDSLARRVDGADSVLMYEVESLEGFGAEPTRSRVMRVSEFDAVSRNQATISRTEAGPVWVRLEGTHVDGMDVDVEFTVSRQGD